MNPILYIVVPCYNEEQVLLLTAPLFLRQLTSMINSYLISNESRILFVNDGSKDSTWEIIENLTDQSEFYRGISLSRNMGHQRALLAGLFEARKYANITITIDCDGQDDISLMGQMIEKYKDGFEIVYAVRNDRSRDTFFKRWTAQTYYRLLKRLGVDIVYNHADYRLVSSQVLDALTEFKEVNLFLRGIFPIIGFKSSQIAFVRNSRLSGTTHYPIKKMIYLAIDGITSFSTKPLHLISMFGLGISILSFIGVLWAVITNLQGRTTSGWASTVSILSLLGGVQMLSLGIIGEYLGKIYLETKERPRFIISKRTYPN